MRSLLLMVLMMVALPGLARTLTVEAVVSPAWVERAGGAREPLQPGAVLNDGDRVLTGGGARALLRVAEGSAVKLGENAQLRVDRMADRGLAAGRVVSGALDVLQGAFRFTTRIFGSPQARRDINVRIVTVTAGIRGTDVWGKSSPDRDVVCLIEGRIYVQHREQAFTMQDPLSFFIAGRDGSRQPVAPVPEAQRQPQRRNTSPDTGRGGRQGHGDCARPAPARRGLSAAAACLPCRRRAALRGLHCRARHCGGCGRAGRCAAQRRIHAGALRAGRGAAYNRGCPHCIMR
jgi:hypothetical protein